MEGDEAAGEYVSVYEATVEGSGTSGVGYHEMRSAQVMALGQNYPNPCRTETTFPLELHQSAKVSLSLWDLNGRCVYQRECGNLPAGTHALRMDLESIQLPAGMYACQVEDQADAYKALDVRQLSSSGH